MATGPAPGSRLIGGAHVRLTLDDRAYRIGLRNAQINLRIFATQATRTLGSIGGPQALVGIRSVTTHVNTLVQSLKDAARAAGLLNRALQSIVASARQMNRLLGGGPAGGFAGAFRGMGIGLATAARGFGSGLGTAIRATGTPIRALGAGLAAVARGFGGGLGSVIRATGTPIRSILSPFTSAARTFATALTQPLRAVGSLITSPLRTAARIFSSTLMAPIRVLGSVTGAISSRLGFLARFGALTGGVGAAFSLAYVVDKITDMEHLLVRLRRTTGATVPEIRQMAGVFNTMGVTLAGIPLNKIYELAIMGSRLGVPREQLALFTRDLARTSAVLEDIPIEDAATYISGLTDVFGLAHTDAIKLASALNELDISSNATGRDILDISARLSGMAATMGLSVQQTLALATAMRQGRVPIETAGTAMSQIFGRMAGKDLPAFARVAGLSIGAFRDLLQKDALEALVAVEQGLGRLDQLGRIRALESLHLDGQRVRLVMLQLIPLLPRLREYLAIANDEWKTSASILRGFAMQAETARAMIDRMWNNVQLLAVSLGSFFLPVLKGVVNGIAGFSGDIREFVEGNGARLQGWGESVGRMFENLGAASRVNWGDIFAVLGVAGRDLWGQFTQRAGMAFDRILILGTNVFDQLMRYMSDVLPTILSNAAIRAGSAVLKALPAPILTLLGISRTSLDASVANLPTPPPASNYFNRQNLTQGLTPIPGLQMPQGILGTIAGLFGAAGAAQRQDRIRREAIGNLGDMLVRLMGRLRGGAPQDPLLRQVRGQAALEGGFGGGGGLGGGLGGVGGDLGDGTPIPPLQMPGGPQGSAPPPPSALSRLGLTALGIPLLGVDDPAAKRQRLLEWRQRMRARHPRAGGPWAAIHQQLLAQRQAQFLALGGGRVLGARARRRAAQGRLEAQRRARMEGRMGVPGEIRDAFGARGAPLEGLGLGLPGNFMGPPQGGMPPGFQFPMGGWSVPSARPQPPLVGIQRWGDTAITRVVDAIGDLTNLIGERLSFDLLP